MKTRKYVKKRIPVEAIQMDEDFVVETLEGVMQGKKGDYLVTGINGEQYPVKKEIFEKTYEPFYEPLALHDIEGTILGDQVLSGLVSLKHIHLLLIITFVAATTPFSLQTLKLIYTNEDALKADLKRLQEYL